MRILFIGDIVGKPGRYCVARQLPRLREENEVDFVIANAENAAGGMGATPETLRELQALGIHAFTMGNHVWRKEELIAALDAFPEMVRPANYPAGVPGHGAALVKLPDGCAVGVLNLLGRVFMQPLDCPFAAADREIAALRAHTPVIVTDMHAEATSEKVAMGWHLDGRCTAVVGSHTHVQTADEWVMPQGTAYISDVGMCGPMHSVIGVRSDRVLERFRTGMPSKFDLAKGPAIFCAALIDADEATGRARGIRRILIRDA